jgi:hypothetical protein
MQGGLRLQLPREKNSSFTDSSSTQIMLPPQRCFKRQKPWQKHKEQVSARILGQKLHVIGETFVVDYILILNLISTLTIIMDAKIRALVDMVRTHELHMTFSRS